MTGRSRTERAAARLIRAACRRLPAGIREERCREWTSELPAIVADPEIRSALRRQVKAMRYAAGIARSSGELSRGLAAADAIAAPPQWRDGAVPGSPASFRMAVGVAITVVFVAATVVLLRFYPELVFAPLLAIVGFDAFCLVDLARASEVRFMSKRAWAVVCLVSIIGGVIYLSIGRVRPQRSH